MACIKKYKRQVIFTSSLFNLDFPDEDGDNQDAKESIRGGGGDDKNEDSDEGDPNEDLKKQETDCITEAKLEYEKQFKKCACEKNLAVSAYQSIASICSNSGPLVMACRQAYNSGRVVPEDWWLGPGSADNVESRTPVIGTAIPFGTHPETDAPWFFSVEIDYSTERQHELGGCEDGSSLYWLAHTTLNRDAEINKTFCRDVINRKYDKLKRNQQQARATRDEHAAQQPRPLEVDPCEEKDGDKL